jgi:Spy/CpxP family protein refolding chaperone
MLASFSASAESVLDVLPTLDSLSSQLELTPEQETQLRPIFEKRMSELQQSQLLLQRASTPQRKDEVLQEAKKAGDDFNMQIESVLTPSQKQEWREIRSGVREKVKERAEE